MLTQSKKPKKFYGTTTIGERGQVVIPAEARRKMKLKKGEKVLVFGFGNDMLAFFKLNKLEEILSHLTSKLEEVRGIIKKTKSK